MHYTELYTLQAVNGLAQAKPTRPGPPARPARILQLEQVFHTLNFRGLGIILKM